MGAHLIDPIDLRGTDLAAGKPFRHAFLPAVGLTGTHAGDDDLSYSAAGKSDGSAFVWINLAPDHRPHAYHVASWADTEEAVNRLGPGIREGGARVIEGPGDCYDYTSGDYAVFSEDLEGNKWEVCCRNPRTREPTGAPSAK